jgi:hypothetical protein
MPISYTEGINHNSVYYTFLFDINWADASADASTPSLASPASSSTSFDLPAWYDRYAHERYGYGPHTADAAEAWAILGDSVYGADQGKAPGWGGGNYRYT